MDFKEYEITIKENISEYVSDVKNVVDDGGMFFLKVSGKSMLPFLKDGKDTVLLKKSDEPSIYDVAFYVRQSGGVVLHRIVAIHGDKFDFCGDNQTEIEKGIPKENIIAVMDAYIRDGKRYFCNSASYKIKSVLWVKTRIFRKFYRNLKIKIKYLVKR
ncbi:MAG: hypothetical protein E7384_06400 [Ruminococcaceae bacterium]|nr:hypothetical protein [Oscillospiraceae bacterium]